MSKIEEMKFKSKHDKYLNQIHKVEMQLKQTYAKYYGQIDEEMKGSLTEDPDFERTHQEKLPPSCLDFAFFSCPH
jgi:hypothetical protein